ncbi:MAG: hypothetical protein WBR09_09550, partial [Serratia proteamaculans]
DRYPLQLLFRLGFPRVKGTQLMRQTIFTQLANKILLSFPGLLYRLPLPLLFNMGQNSQFTTVYRQNAPPDQALTTSTH